MFTLLVHCIRTTERAWRFQALSECPSPAAVVPIQNSISVSIKYSICFNVLIMDTLFTAIYICMHCNLCCILCKNACFVGARYNRSTHKRLGNTEEDDEGEREKPRTSGAVTELLLKIFDDELVVRHVGNQPCEGGSVHKRDVLVVDVKDKEAVDEEIGCVFDIHVSVRNTACVVRRSKKG